MQRTQSQKCSAHLSATARCSFPSYLLYIRLLIPHSLSSLTAHHPLQPQQLRRIVDNQLLGREGHLLELLRIRGGDLGARDADRRGLEVVERVLSREREQLGADAEAGEAALDGHHAARLLDRRHDRLDVERLDAAQVDHLGLDAVLALELLGRDERLADATREGDDGEVLAGALDLGLAELGNLLALGKCW